MMSNATPDMEPARFHRYTLSGLIPDGDALSFNFERGVLSQLRAGEIVEQQIFSPGEGIIVKALLEEYPAYCPYEIILHEMTGKSVERCRASLYRCMEENRTVDPVMRPVRNIMGRCREKMHPFGIQITSMVHMGYMLVPARSGIHAH